MNKKRVAAAVAGALVAGVVMGSAVSGFAASKSSPPTSATTTGLRLGASMRQSGARLLDVVAKLTGLTTGEVAAERKAGKTFTQIAATKNVDASAVVAEAINARQELLSTKVKDGTITQAQSDAALAKMKARLTSRVDSTNPNCTGAGAGSGQSAGAGCATGRAGAGGCGAGGGCGSAGCAAAAN